MIWPVFSAVSQVIPAIRVAVDYKSIQPLSTDEFPAMNPTGSLWDYAIWDEALWSDGSDSISADWVSADGIGTVATVHIVTSTSIAAKLNAIDIQYEVARGGNL